MRLPNYFPTTERGIFLCLLALSLLAHFAYFGHPNQTVFDEVHFGKFISGYYTHEYYFDIHPPLGKLIIAGFGKLFDFRPEFSFSQIGDAFPDNKYMALRFLPSLAGSLLVPVIFLFALQLGFNRRGAALSGLLILFSGAYLVQSRLILLDAFLLLFGFSALTFFLAYRNTGKLKYLAAFSVLAAMAASVKWTGISFLAVAGLFALVDLYPHRRQFYKYLPRLIFYFAVIPFVIYYSIFAVHFALLSKSGEGDAFMSAGFKKTLTGSEFAGSEAAPLNNFQKFLELNAEMYRSNQRLTATHSYSSLWYTWPFMTRAIYYWVDGSNPDAIARIYLIGNPFVWWASTAALVFVLITASTQLRLPDKITGFLLAGYVLNLLPFVGISRVMFLYHYLTALVFAILLLAYVVEKYGRNPKALSATILILSVIGFIFFSPLLYGFPLSDPQYKLRTWLNSWI